MKCLAMLKQVRTFFCFAFCMFCSYPLHADGLISDDFVQSLLQKPAHIDAQPKTKVKPQPIIQFPVITPKEKSVEKKSDWLSNYLKFLKAEEKKYKTRYPVYPEAKVANFLFGWMPEYQELRDAKAEMERKSELGFYNYSHRLAMCRIGQMVGVGSYFSPMFGFVFSAVKELDDLYQKSIVGNKPFKTIFIQCLVDMENAYEAVLYGINHPDEDCRERLEYLDYKTNTWKKEKVNPNPYRVYIKPKEIKPLF